MENNKNKKSVKFQGDMLNFCDFIQVFVFTRNHHLKVVIISNLGQRQKSALNAENTTDLPETLQVPSLCCFS